MNLYDFFTSHPRVALGFSGGVDSSYLAYTARKYADEVLAIYYKSEFQPEFEFQDALRFCDTYDIPLKIIHGSTLCDYRITANPADRCYFCKRQIFSAIQKEAVSEGFSILLDGTNSSDQASDRPGMRALQELSVLSPLRLCNLTKDDIRTLSKEEGLFTWKKPAYACLATRIPTGMTITAELLTSVETCESILFSMGFHDFRVRVREDHALLQVLSSEYDLAVVKMQEIRQQFFPYFSDVRLDSIVR